MARVAFVSSYPPRTCGMATFTDHLGRVAGDREIVALDVPDERPAYPIEVHHRIRIDERIEFVRVGGSIGSCVDVASIQFDPAVWGADDGEAVLDFLGALTVPSVVTFHEVPQAPSSRQRAIVQALHRGARASIVMSHAGADLLQRAYDVDPGALEVIPHGVPDLPMVDAEASAAVAAALDLAGQEVILSFGLLGPEKGCELVLDALPTILAARPRACYAIVGSTHPDVLHRDGEAYRHSLADRVRSLGLAKHVRFVDRFLGRVELMRWLQAASVVVAPQAARQQISSGTIVYAMATGRPVVSAPHALATELLGAGAGIVLAERSAAAMAAAVIDLLGDGALREAIGREAHRQTRAAVWSKVGSEYQRVFDRVAPPSPEQVARGGPPARRSSRVRAR